MPKSNACLNVPRCALEKRGTNAPFCDAAHPNFIKRFNMMANSKAQSGHGGKHPCTYTGECAPLLPHGGPRRRAGQSAGLSPLQVANLIDAATMAMAMGKPLNAFWTVHWGALGLSDNQAGQASQALLRQARDWLRDRGAAAIWVWTRENDTASERKGAHIHALVHVPQKLRPKFARRLQRWTAAAAGCKNYVAKASRFKPVGPRVGCEIALPEVYRANLREVMGYLLKGVPESAAGGLERIWQGEGAAMPNPGSGGFVSGKRAGVSRALARRVTTAGHEKPATTQTDGGVSNLEAFRPKDRYLAFSCTSTIQALRRWPGARKIASSLIKPKGVTFL